MTGTLERQGDVWSVSQVAKTQGFHPWNRSSILLPTPTSEPLNQLTLLKMIDSHLHSSCGLLIAQRPQMRGFIKSQKSLTLYKHSSTG